MPERTISNTVLAETTQWLSVYYTSLVKEHREYAIIGYRRLDLERPQIMRIIQQCANHQHWQAISDLVKGIGQYLDRQGYWTELQIALDTNLNAARQQDDHQDEGWCLGQLGYNALNRCDYMLALEYLKQSLAIQQEIGDNAWKGTILNNIGLTYQAQGDYATALQYLGQSLVIYQEIGDKAGEGRTLNNLATTAYTSSDYVTALAYLEQCIAIQKEIGDKVGEGATLNNISQIYHNRGDYATTLKYLKQSLAIYQENGDKTGASTILNNIGQLYHDRDDYATALFYIEQSLAMSQEIGDVAGMCVTLFNKGHIHFHNEEQPQAFTAWLAMYRLAKPRNIAQALKALEKLTEQLGLPGGLDGWETLSRQMNEDEIPFTPDEIMNT